MHIIKINKSILIISVLLLASFVLYAQETKKIQFTADIVEYDEKLAKGAQRLLGNVHFTHDDMVMFCDSAYYLPSEKIVDAYSNVH